MSFMSQAALAPQFTTEREPGPFAAAFDTAWRAAAAGRLPSPADLASALSPATLSQALVVDVARDGDRLSFRPRLTGTGFSAWLSGRGARISALPAELERDLVAAAGSGQPVLDEAAAVYPLSRNGGDADTLVALVAARPTFGQRLRSALGL